MQKSIVFGKVLALALLAMVTTAKAATKSITSSTAVSFSWEAEWVLRGAGQGVINFTVSSTTSLRDVCIALSPSASPDTTNGIYLDINGWGNTAWIARTLGGTNLPTGNSATPENYFAPIVFPTGTVDVQITVNQPQVTVSARANTGTTANTAAYTQIFSYTLPTTHAAYSPTTATAWKYFSFAGWNNTLSFSNISTASLSAAPASVLQGNCDTIKGYLDSIQALSDGANTPALKQQIANILAPAPGGNANYQWSLANDAKTRVSAPSITPALIDGLVNQGSAAVTQAKLAFNNAVSIVLQANVTAIQANINAITLLVNAATDAPLKGLLNGFLGTSNAQLTPANAAKTAGTVATVTLDAANQAVSASSIAAALATTAQASAAEAKNDFDKFATNKAAAPNTIAGNITTIQASINAINALINAAPAASDLKTQLTSFLTTAQAQLVIANNAKTVAASATTVAALNTALEDTRAAAATATDAQNNATRLPSFVIPVNFEEEAGKTDSIAVGGNAIYCISLDGKQLLSYNNYNMNPNPWEAVALIGLPSTVLLEAVASGADNTTCVLDANGVVYKLVPTADMKSAVCSALPMTTVAPVRMIVNIAVGDANNIWAVDKDKNIVQHSDQLGWIVRAAGVGHDISVGGDGYVVGINTEGDPFFFVNNNNNGKWSKLPDLPNDLNIDQIAVVATNDLYAISEDSRLWRFVAPAAAAGQPAGKAAWTVLKDASGKEAKGFKNIAVNAVGTVFATAVNDEIYNTDIEFVVIVPLEATVVPVARAPQPPQDGPGFAKKPPVVAPPAGQTIAAPILPPPAPELKQASIVVTSQTATIQISPVTATGKGKNKGIIKKAPAATGKISRGQGKKTKKIDIKVSKKQAVAPAKKQTSKVKQANQKNKAHAKVTKVTKVAAKKGGKPAAKKEVTAKK